MDFRTDLALERCEILDKKNTDGIEIEFFEAKKAKVSRISVTNENGEKAVGKPK